MATSIWFWVLFNAFVLVMLAIDLGLFHREARVVTPKEAATWTGIWVCLALLFAGGLYVLEAPHTSLTFLAGYIIEESLSADNVFVFVMIFAYFAIPPRYQHRVLIWGIIGALVLRGTFIMLGAYAVAQLHWLIYVFGALLVVTGTRMMFSQDEAFDAERNIAYRVAKRVLPFTTRYDGQRFFTREAGRLVATPLFLVLVIVDVTDLVFAIDSIPAIFAVTQDPFVVYTSNVFAILGLRSLYFLLAQVVDRFHLLKYGLATILAFVGGKMLLSHWYEIPIGVSLLVVLGILVAAIVASMLIPAPPKKGPAPKSAFEWTEP